MDRSSGTSNGNNNGVHHNSGEETNNGASQGAEQETVPGGQARTGVGFILDNILRRSEMLYTNGNSNGHSLGKREEVGSSRNQENLGRVGFGYPVNPQLRAFFRMGIQYPRSSLLSVRVKMGMGYPVNPALNSRGVDMGMGYPGNRGGNAGPGIGMDGPGNPGVHSGFNLGMGYPGSPRMNAGSSRGIGYPRNLEANSDVNTGMGSTGNSEANQDFSKNFPTMAFIARNEILENLPTMSSVDRAKVLEKIEELDRLINQKKEVNLEMKKLTEMLKSAPDIVLNVGDDSLSRLMAFQDRLVELAERELCISKELSVQVDAKKERGQEEDTNEN